MIQEKLKELELQLNYVCYDKELITRLSKVWDAYYDLKSEIKKLNIPDVVGQSEQLVCDNHSPDLEHFMKYSESICKNCKQKV